MDKLYSFLPRRTLFLIIFLVVCILVLAILLYLSKQPKKITPFPAPVISQTPSKLSSLQKSVIGKTTPEELEKKLKFQIKNKLVLENGGLSYSIESKLEERPSLVLFRNNLAQFEMIVVLGDRSAAENPRLSNLVLQYGLPEKEIKGSRFYGNHMTTYIYAAKGFALIANSYTDEVDELQIFTPTSVDNYLKTYGEDIGEREEILEDFQEL